jgi:hypothetical protein
MKTAEITSSKKTFDKAAQWNELLSSKYEGWELDFICSSFYLPTDVLKNSRFVVKPIRIISGPEYGMLLSHAAERKASALVSPKTTKILIINEGANSRMLQNAEAVGISEREITGKSTTVLLCKIWYGNRGDKANREQVL